MLQILIYIFLGLVVLSMVGVFLVNKISARLAETGEPSPSETSILFEKSAISGNQFQIIQALTQETPPGSTLVIPLIPIPLSRKETVTRTFIEVMDPHKNLLWKSADLGRLIHLPGQIQSLSEIDIARKVLNIFTLDQRTGDILAPPIMQRLDISGDLPFDIHEMVNFIDENRGAFEKILGLPIGLIVQYSYQTPQGFREKASQREKATSFYYNHRWLDIYYFEGETRHHVTVKIALDTQGRVDLKKEPEYGKKATTEEKDYAWKVLGRLDQFFDEHGVSFKDYVEQANQAFLKK